MLGTYKACGEIDMATAPAFNAGIYTAIEAADEAIVVVDCAGVTFIDSAGYHVLVEMTAYAVRRGHTLVIRNLSAGCASVIRLCDRDVDLHVDDHDRGRLKTAS